MSRDDSEIEPEAEPATRRKRGDAGPLGLLPWLSPRQVRLEQSLASGTDFARGLARLADSAGIELGTSPPEIRWQASGLKRTGLVVQFSWPRLTARVGVGIETPVVHALVDRLLGYERVDEDQRLQITPVEWGVMTFLASRVLNLLREGVGPFGYWDLTIDRVGPDSFDPSALGRIVTLRWPARVGPIEGSAWLWLPETLVARWLMAEPPPISTSLADPLPRFGDLASWWRAEAGVVALPQGLRMLRVGGVLLLRDSPLRGTPQSPAGSINLGLVGTDPGAEFGFPAEVVPYSAGSRLTLHAPLQRHPAPREAIPLNPAPEPSRTSDAGIVSPTDVPVTLVVELGRVNLPLRRLADLKPGDVVELGRHSREPVELTSGGRLVARGELVLIDTELGVRVTSVFL